MTDNAPQQWARPKIIGKTQMGLDDYGDMLIFTCAVCLQPRFFQTNGETIRNCPHEHDYEGHCHHFDPWGV